MRKVSISRKAYREAVSANKKIAANLYHIPAHLRPKYVALIGTTTVQFVHMSPNEYDSRGRPEVPVGNIKNTHQRTLATNPGFLPEDRVELVWRD
jgi:hypothetical protein